MLTSTLRTLAAAALVAALGANASAQQPPAVVNGRVTASPAGSPFAQSFRGLIASAIETTWVGYAVPVVDRARFMCCDGSGRGMTGDDGRAWGGCRLESSPAEPAADPGTRQAAAPRTVQLEGSDRIAVLFRVVARSVERIRVVSADCVLDAGGRPVLWIDGVRPADSVALLESLALAPDGSARVIDGAVMAIALHGDESADASLDRLVTLTARRRFVRKSRSGSATPVGGGGSTTAAGDARGPERRGAEERHLCAVAEPHARSDGHARVDCPVRCGAAPAQRGALLAGADGRAQGGRRRSPTRSTRTPIPR